MSLFKIMHTTWHFMAVCYICKLLKKGVTHSSMSTHTDDFSLCMSSLILNIFFLPGSFTVPFSSPYLSFLSSIPLFSPPLFTFSPTVTYSHTPLLSRSLCFGINAPPLSSPPLLVLVSQGLPYTLIPSHSLIYIWTSASISPLCLWLQLLLYNRLFRDHKVASTFIT